MLHKTYNIMDKKFVITIGRQLGAGGRQLAEELGRRLGVPVYNRESIDEAAKQSGLAAELFEKADEHESNLTPLGSGIWGFGSMTSPGYINNDTLFGIQSQTIESLADRSSCIIVGRCADYVLRERERVLSVFVTAPLVVRQGRERVPPLGSYHRAPPLVVLQLLLLQDLGRGGELRPLPQLLEVGH